MLRHGRAKRIWTSRSVLEQRKRKMASSYKSEWKTVQDTIRNKS
nr:MAG TPA: hypothetical protein [Bacteriophage sp.]